MEDESKKELHKKICVNLLLTLFVIAFVIFLLPGLIRFFMPMIIAWIIAMIANPLVHLLETKIRMLRKHGSVIVIVAVLLIVAAALVLLVNGAVHLVLAFSKDFPALYDQVLNNLETTLESLHKRFYFIPADLQDIIGKNGSSLSGMVSSLFDSVKDGLLQSAGSVASSIIEMVILTILTLMLSYFFVVKMDAIKEAVRSHTPQGVRDFWNMAMNTCIRAIGAYLKACLIIGIVVFLILIVIFGAVMHTNYTVLLAFLTAFMDFLPFLGTGIIIVPWAVYCAVTGEYLNVLILVITYLICLLVHRLMEPKLISNSVEISPMAILISMLIGYRLIGMLGLILGIPVAMVIMTFWEEGVFDSQIRGIRILIKDLDEYRKY
ncbi:MAG: AI-2E family transporter [Clostridiaceae bacterium]|nr:AI-2E family transporter [Clostridiaceae bacterium]